MTVTTGAAPPVATTLGAFCADVVAAPLPDALSISIPQRVLDVLGLCARATTLDTSRLVTEVTAADGGTPESTVIGSSTRLPAAAAAFVNGVLAHSLDYDDTHLPSIVHPSASVVPAALAAAEAAEADGATVAAAVACGLEITIRLGMAGYDPTANDGTGQSIYFEHGQHATSICGALGSAAAAAIVFTGADDTHPAHDIAGTVTNAVAIAASMSSGIIEANRTGGTVKRIHCGLAARSGIQAARLALGGLTGAPTAIEGRFGFLRAWLHDDADPAAVTDGLGERWAAADTFYKPYPANHFAHAALDAAVELRRRGLDPEDVVALHLGVASPTVRTIGEPIEAKRAPATGYQGQFSGPYLVATGLTGGSGLGFGLDDITDDAVRRPDRVRLMALTTVGSDPRCDEIYPHQFPAVLTATTSDGTTHEAFIPHNRGGNLQPLTDEELRRKFLDNTDGLLDESVAEKVAHATAELAESADLDAVLGPFRAMEVPR